MSALIPWSLASARMTTYFLGQDKFVYNSNPLLDKNSQSNKKSLI
jgi:hypothetical protein